MMQTLKIFLNIIHNRRLEQDIGERHFSFGNLSEQVKLCHEHVCRKMHGCKSVVKIRYKGHQSYYKLYYNQKAVMKIGKELSNEIDIRRGARQVCKLSPIRFNVNSETNT